MPETVIYEICAEFWNNNVAYLRLYPKLPTFPSDIVHTRRSTSKENQETQRIVELLSQGMLETTHFATKTTSYIVI